MQQIMTSDVKNCGIFSPENGVIRRGKKKTTTFFVVQHCCKVRKRLFTNESEEESNLELGMFF